MRRQTAILTTMSEPTPSVPPDAPPATAQGTQSLGANEYRELFHRFGQGFCVFEVLLDDHGRPVDYRFLEVNEAFERFTGLRSPVGRTALELVPDLEPHWIEVYGRVALTGEPTHFAQGSEAMGRWFDVYASRVGAPEKRRVALLFNDITAYRTEQEERRRAEGALRASAHRFRLFADTAPAMLWVTEEDGQCSYLSRGWYEYTGQTEREGLGYGWLDVLHPDDRESARRAFIAANERRQPFELEHRLHRADGVSRWVLDAGRPRFRGDGSFQGYVGSVIDIHDRKIAEDRLDLAVNSGKVGLWYCDLPFDMLIWNRQVKEHFGLPPDAVVTIETFSSHLHPDDRDRTFAAIDAAIQTHSTFDAQYRTVGLDGITRWIRAIGRARYDGERPVSFDGITVDITELVQLRESAEAANRAKDEFLAMLGHELRNPLAPILTALELLKLHKVEAAERERAVIERQVRHLVGLVDDLLDVSRITRGRVELRRARVDVADAVARAVEIASPLLEERRHTFVLNMQRGLIVDADPGRLAQIFANLLTNAAKYTEVGGAVAVEVRREADAVVIDVRDSGIGIDKEMLPRIFESFVQQPQSLARSQGGLGLGLSIVRSLVELHGGTVSASSEGKGQGATFTVRLPSLAGATTADPTSTPDRTAPRTAAGTRVLIVDDNHDAAGLLGALLHEFGYETRVVHDAPSALTEAARFQPQLALIDIGLPVMNGLELAQRFSEHPQLKPMKLVAITGYGQDRDRETSARSGFSAHLVKPVDADELQSVLAALARAPDPSRP